MGFSEEEINKLHSIIMAQFDREGKFTEKEKELLIKFGSAFSEAISPLLCGNQQPESVIPVFLVLFACRENLRLNFADDGILVSDNTGSALLKRLLSFSNKLVDKSEIPYLVEIDKCIRSLERPNFKIIFHRLIDQTLVSTNAVGGTQELPNFRIARTASNILREHGCDTIGVIGSGLGSFGKACKEANYVGIEQNGSFRLIADAVCEGTNACSYRNVYGTFLSGWENNKFDGVIGNLPVDADFFNEYRFSHLEHKFNDLAAKFIIKLLPSGVVGKTAITLVHFDFANKCDFDLLRKQLCENGLLETVIALPENIFINANVPTYMLVFDMKGRHDDVEFIDATASLVRDANYSYCMYGNDFDLREQVLDSERIVVPHSTMEQLDWSFNPKVYLQNAECPEGMELVRLGDLASMPEYKEVKGERTLSSDFFSERFEKVAKGVTPSSLSGQFKMQLIEGPSLIFSLTSGHRRDIQRLRCAICNDKGVYSTDTYAAVLQPNPDRTSLEYLALALMNDPTFAGYLKSVQAYDVDDFRRSHILERRIPVYTDLSEQKKAVTRALGRADMADTVYNVVLAGAGGKSSVFASLLSEYGCVVKYVAEKVEGQDGLELILSEYTKSNTPVSKKIDAVIFNTELQLSAAENQDRYAGLDAVLDLQLKYGNSSIPFYAFSDKDLDSILSEARIFERRLKSLRQGHFFMNGKNSKPSIALVRALREELESGSSVDAKIRTLYREGFEAAEWLDSTYPESNIHSVEVLSDFLTAAEMPEVNTTRKIADMRIVVHEIIGLLGECNAVPADLDKGAVPKYLYDGKYKDKRTRINYFQRIEIMPKSLAASVFALVSIGNEGVHTFNSRPNLAMSMAQSLMEFIQWFYSNKELFKNKLSGYWSYGDDFVTVSDEIEGVVELKKIDGKNVWTCRDVMLVYDKTTPLKVGDKVVIKKRLSQQNPKLIENGILWIANSKQKDPREGYEIKNS